MFSAMGWYGRMSENGPKGWHDKWVNLLFEEAIGKCCFLRA